MVALRFASGEVAEAEVIGVAPNYDLAVLRISNARGSRRRHSRLEVRRT